MKKYEFGGGITKKNKVSFDGSETYGEIKAFFKKYNESYELGRIKLAEAVCKEILKSQGLPIEPVEYFDLPPLDVQSQEWYALEILKQIGLIESALGRSDLHNGMESAFQVGLLWKEAELKFEWERHALKGESFKPGRNKGAWSDIKLYLFDLWMTSKPRNFKEFWRTIDSNIGHEQDGSIILQEIVDEEQKNESDIKLNYVNGKCEEKSVSKKQIREYMTEFKKKHQNKIPGSR